MFGFYQVGQFHYETLPFYRTRSTVGVLTVLTIMMRLDIVGLLGLVRQEMVLDNLLYDRYL